MNNSQQTPSIDAKESPLIVSEQGQVKSRTGSPLPVEELHSRHFPRVASPARVSHISVSHDGDALQQQLAHLANLAESLGATPPTENVNSYYIEGKDYQLRWERHTEFSTYTLIAPRGSGSLFSEPAIALLPTDWVTGLCGRLLSAIHVEILAFPDPRPDIQWLRELFGDHYLIASSVNNDETQLWTALRTHDDGFSRMLIYSNETSTRKIGRLLRTVLELETYTNMALLGLPLVRAIIPDVKEMEEQLTNLTDRLNTINGLIDEKAILKDLSGLSARIERIMASTSSRFAATRAYFELVVARVKELNEKPIDTLRTLSSFMERRLHPAVKTCESGQQRLSGLSKRVNSTSALLRTRVDLTIQEQNQELLRSMDKRSKISLYLQRSVEGLSVIIISYYTLGLIKLALTGSKSLPHTLNIDLITAILVPIILLTVGFSLHRIKKRVEAEFDDKDNEPSVLTSSSEEEK